MSFRSRLQSYRSWPLALLALVVTPVLAQSASEPETSRVNLVPAQQISTDAQAVLDRMTATLQGLKSFSVAATGSRDELLPYSYKLQSNESATLVVRRPDRLRAEIRGDLRTRSIVYDGTKLTMYSPQDAAYVRLNAPPTLGALIGGLLDLGVELPLIDVLYHGTTGTLTEGVRTGIWVGETTIDGVACDHLAFRQAAIDWQLWVQKGEKALPRKMLITTRYTVGEPQWQATLDWNLQPTIGDATFRFDPPAGTTEVSFVGTDVVGSEANGGKNP